MSQKALSMRKIKEVLRLRYDLGLPQNEIARSCSIGQASVHRYLERASSSRRTDNAILLRLSRAGRILKLPIRNRGTNSCGLLISPCSSFRDDGFGGCLKFLAHAPSRVGRSPMANLLGHVLKKGPAQSVILHVLVGSQPYHDRKTCCGLLTNDVEIVCTVVNQ
jgi:hypothetical protein